MFDAVLDKAYADWRKGNSVIGGMAQVMVDDGVLTIRDMFAAAKINKDRSEECLRTIGLNPEDPVEDFVRWA
jgi:hypothetical protein